MSSTKKKEVDENFIDRFNQLFEKVDKIEERLQDVVKIKELCTGMETKLENF